MSTDLITQLVSIYSPSTHEAPAVNFLVEWMLGHGFNAFRDEVGNAVGIRGNPDAPHTLILLGHIDTVTGEIPVRIDAGKLYGRGSVDAKGSLCAFAEATAQASIPDNWRVIVVGAVEEEVPSSKGAHFIRDHYQPDLAIIGEPSGVDRLALGYKGRLLMDYCYSQPLTHTARIELSAGEVGFGVWQQIRQWVDSVNMGRERLFDQLLCRLQSIQTHSDGFSESVQMTIGWRLPLDIDSATILEYLTPLASGGTFIPYGETPAYRTDKNSPIVRQMLTAMRAEGLQPAFTLKTGTSDLNVVGTVWDCPMVVYGAGDSNLDHTPDEHLDLAEYEQAIRVLKRFIEQLSK